MPIIKFTDVFLRKLKGENIEYSDEYICGLRIRIYKKQKKVFSYLYTMQGRKRRLTIGQYPYITLRQARNIVEKAKVDLNNSIDPQVKKDIVKEEQSQEQRITVGEGFDIFMEKYATKNLKSWKQYQTCFNKLDKQIHKLCIEEVQPITIRKYLDKVATKSGLRTSNLTYAYLRSAFGWLWKNQYTDSHPMERMQKPNPQGERTKDRVLTDAELTAVMTATETMGYPFGDFIKVLTLTGQRRNETSLMEWHEVDLANKQWTIPATKTKNSKEHIVPLSNQVISLLKATPQRTGFVFSTTDGEKAIGCFNKAQKCVCETANVYNWSFHDLRRTLATNLSKQQTSDVVISAILNHSTRALQGVTSIYNRHTLMPERTNALNGYADWIDGLRNNHNDKKP